MSSGVTATTTLGWRLEDLRCSDQIDKIRKLDSAGPPPVYSMTFLRTERWTLEIARKLVKVTKFNPANGEKKTSFSFETGGGVSVTWLATARQWICVEDHLRLTDFITGESEQRQVWQYNSPPEVIDETEWEA